MRNLAALIPADPRARDMMTRWLQVKDRDKVVSDDSTETTSQHELAMPAPYEVGAGKNKDNIDRTQTFYCYKWFSSTGWIYSICEDVVVTSNRNNEFTEGNGGGVDDGGWPDSDGMPDGDDGVPDGGGQLPPDSDPCDTGNPVLDDTSFQGLMNEAAKESGFGETEDNRLESWYAIKEQNGSYAKELVPYTEGSRTSCSYQINTTSSFFNNAVALIHTHPYAPGDMIYNQACLEYRNEDSPRQYTFDGPSQADVDIANDLSLDLYTMDYDNIHFTDKNDIMTGQAETITRCGY